jgi:hypothetical protein
MIRPFSVVCVLLAAGSGMYLYQAKHDGYVLDQTITDLQKQTGQVLQRIGVLQGEYALLNDPSRLQDLAQAHLPQLQALQPRQFTRLADLDERLPAVQAPAPAAPPAAPAPEPSLLVDVPTAGTPVAAASPEASSAVAAAVPRPIAQPVVPVAVVPRPHPKPHPVLVAARPPVVARVSYQAPRPVFVPQPAYEPASAPMETAQPASLLGMARDIPGDSRSAVRGYGK